MQEAVQIGFLPMENFKHQVQQKNQQKTVLVNKTGNNEKLTLIAKELKCCYFKVLQVIECDVQKKANKSTLKHVVPSSFP